MTEATTFGRAWLASNRRGAAFLLACPLIAMAPVLVELAQHAAEVHIGMYDSLANAQALETHPLRMGFGYAKMLVMMLVGFFAIRYAATGDAGYAARPDRASLLSFAPFLAFQILATAGMEMLAPRGEDALGPFLAIFFGSQAIGVLIALWGAAAALGNARVGPMLSLSIMSRRFLWSFAMMFAVMTPWMILHYGFAALTLLGPKTLLWPALIADSLLVGLLAAVLPASSWFAAKRAADRSGIPLFPARTAAE